MNDQGNIFRKWFWSTVGGWLVGFAIVVVLAMLFNAAGMNDYQFFIGIGMAIGVGFLQGQRLKFADSLGLNWMWSAIFGMGISFVFFDLGHHFTTLIPEYNLMYSVSVGGLITGLLQGHFLRPYTQNHIFWVVYSWIGWTAAGLMAMLSEHADIFSATKTGQTLVALVFMIVLASVLLALITGYGIKKLLSS